MSLLLTYDVLYSLLDCLRCPRSPCRYPPRRGMEGLRIHTRRRCCLLRPLRQCPRLRQGPTSHHDQGVPGGVERVPSRMLPPLFPKTPPSQKTITNIPPPHRPKTPTPSAVSPPRATRAQEWSSPHRPSRSKACLGPATTNNRLLYCTTSNPILGARPLFRLPRFSLIPAVFLLLTMSGGTGWESGLGFVQR